MRAAALAALLAAAVMLGACGGGSSVQSRGTTTTSTATTSTGGPPITVGIICMTPTDAAHALVDAWTSNDRGAAGRCASDAAVAALFGRRGDPSWAFQGCDGPDPGVPICTYRGSGGTLRLTLMGTEAQGWKVTDVAFA